MRARRDIYRVVAKPGTAHLARAHTPGTMEHVILATGRARVGPQGEPVELAPGDYLRYPGDLPHVFDALEPDTVAVFILEHV
jgi:quercetin dioxygenase-like cupin family protein